MDYELIVAMSKNLVIGDNDKMPWHIQEDLKFFKDITMNSIIVMGRKTFESLPNGPLCNRHHIVISRNPSFYTNSEKVSYCSPSDADRIIKQYRGGGQKVFIIGGAEIYHLFFHSCVKLHITYIDMIVDGDTYFPYTFDNLLERGFSISNTSNVIVSQHNNINFQKYTFVYSRICQ
jgi:dihydrofolate reductase